MQMSIIGIDIYNWNTHIFLWKYDKESMFVEKK